MTGVRLLSAVFIAAPAFGQSSAAFAQPAPAPLGTPAAAPGVNAPPIDVAGLVQKNLLQDIDTIRTAKVQSDRDEAGRRLISRHDADGRREIIASLNMVRNQPAQLAAAHAILDDPEPTSDMIDPLAKLLGIPGQGGLERPLTEAAAAALANFHGATPADSDAAVARLRDWFAVDPKSPSRFSAIHALGTSAEQKVAGLLIELTQNERDRNFAADALVEMTQLPENGRDARAWAAWWNANRTKSNDQFKAELLERGRRRRTTALTDLDTVVGRLYQLAAEPAKPEALRVILNSSDSQFRAAGIRLAFQEFNRTGRPPESMPRIREMIRDSSPDVRTEAANLVFKLNDKPSLEALLAQLAIDKDAGVRVAILQALAQIRDVRAVPLLITLLSDPSLRTATTAAETIAKLGEEIRKDPQLAATTTAALVRVIGTRGNQDATGDLKAACVEALVPLRDAAQRDLLLNLLDGRQSSRTRRAALAALGELPDPNGNIANAVFGLIQNEKRDQTVRYSALDAIKRLHSISFTQQLLDLSLVEREDPDVKKRAAGVFESLLADAEQRQLDEWADKFLRAQQYDRLIPVLTESLRRKETTDPKGAAALRESIGEAYRQLKRPQDGIPFFRLALDYWQNNNGSAQAQNGPRTGLMLSLLEAKQYPEAGRLAQEAMLRDPHLEPDVMKFILAEAVNLVQAGDRQGALRLTDEGLRVSGLKENWKANLLAQKQKATELPATPIRRP